MGTLGCRRCPRSVAFVAGGGVYGYPGGQQNTIAAPPEGSFEALALEAELDEVWVELETLQDPRLRGRYSARPLGHESFTGEWWRVFDAVVFHREMTPSTLAR